MIQALSVLSQQAPMLYAYAACLLITVAKVVSKAYYVPEHTGILKNKTSKQQFIFLQGIYKKLWNQQKHFHS
jgi:hypothetical protein